VVGKNFTFCSICDVLAVSLCCRLGDRKSICPVENLLQQLQSVLPGTQPNLGYLQISRPVKQKPAVCVCVAASMRLCMGSRRGFIIRMKIGNLTSGSVDSVSAASHCMRVRQRSTLGPSADGQQYAVVHVTGYIKNWPPAGMCSVSHYLSGACAFHA